MAKPDRCPTCNQTLPRKKTSKHPGVFQRRDGKWVGVVELPQRDGNRRRKQIVRTTEIAAVRARGELLNQLAQRGDIETTSTNVGVWFSYWLSQIAIRQVAPQTYKSYASHVRNHLVPYLGERTRLDHVTPQRIRGLETYYLSKGTSSSHAAIGFAVLRRSLRDAHREGRIDSNPCVLVDPPRKRVIEREALTVEESIKVLQVAATDRWGAAWAIAILTGARRGEILGLEVDRITDHLDFSWQLQRLKVLPNGDPIAPSDYEWRRTALREAVDNVKVSERFFLTRPKSKSGWRVVPLVEPLKSILQRHLQRPGAPTEGLVFRGAKGGPLSPDILSAAWKKLLVKADVNPNVVFHGARHTTVDLLYMAGVPEDIIQEIVGHSTRGMTRSYKSKGNTQRLTDAMLRVSALLMPPDAPTIQSVSE